MESVTDALADDGSADVATQFEPCSIIVTLRVATRTRMGAWWQRTRLVHSIFEFLDNQPVRAALSLHKPTPVDSEQGRQFELVLSVQITDGTSKASTALVVNGIHKIVGDTSGKCVTNKSVASEHPLSLEPEAIPA